jgi:prepilin-type processing-associated H-X9-DG protein
MPRDIPDGTSATIMLAEKWLRPDEYTGGQWNDDHNIISGLDQDALRIGDRPPLHDALLDNKCCLWWRDNNDDGGATYGSRFGGAHPSGVNSLFVDGSVHNIRYNINTTVFAGLCRRNDGGVIDAGEIP